MLSQRAKSLKPSPTLALASKAKALMAEGHDVISLSVGEPDWKTAEDVRKVGVDAINNGDTRYFPAAGLPELRKAIADQVNNDLGFNYEAKNVTATAGAKIVVFSAVQAVADPGDEVLIPAPYWVSYPTMVELADAKPVIIETEASNDFKLTPELLEASITEKTKAIIFNSPSNPIGVIYSDEELKALGEVLKRHPRIVLISDDIYNRLVFESELAPHILTGTPELKDRTVLVNGVSKSYAMTGWRVGWGIGPEEITGAMAKYLSQAMGCGCMISQKAAVQAVKEGDPEVRRSVGVLKERLESAFKGLNEIGFKAQKPGGAFYLWCDISEFLGKSLDGKKLETSRDFSEALLSDQLVAIVPGLEFGVEGYVRLSYALGLERMNEAIERMGAFLKKLN